MPKTEYGPRPHKLPKFSGKTEKPTQFLFTKGKGPGIDPGSMLSWIGTEATDYQNGFCITFCFERWTSDSLMLQLRDIMNLTRGQTAKDVIKELRGLADRLQESCVDKVEGKEKPF